MGNSADRRTERREKERERNRELVLWCSAGALAIVLIFAAPKNPLWAGVLLASLWSLLIIPVTHIPLVRDALPGWNRSLARVIATLIMTAFVFYFGASVWPHPGLDLLTESEQLQFISKLESIAGERTPVSVMCPPNEEKECVLASQFVEMFGRAGWPLVSQRVERVAAGRPQRGFYFVLHSIGDKDYSNPIYRKPGVGVWTQRPVTMPGLKSLFNELGLGSSVHVGTAWPERTLGLYFGTGTARQ